jgi:hypothetical protein
MVLTVVLVSGFIILVGILIYQFEKPIKNGKDLSGRGGDFES